jgi:hypothetical protein
MPLPVINFSPIIQASMSLNFEIPKKKGTPVIDNLELAV